MLAIMASMMMYAAPVEMPTMIQDNAPAAVSNEEAGDLAAREAQNPELAEFEAGDALGVAILILVIVGIVAIVWLLLENARR